MDEKIVHVKLPENIHRELKVYAATNGLTIRDALIKLIQEAKK